MSAREIGRRLGVGRSTIQDNLKRAAAAGLAWPLADDITDEALETRLYGRAAVTQGQRRRPEPDWAALAREPKRPGVTMTILWEEYREVQAEGYGYSRFYDLLRGFERHLTPVVRQHHVAGEKAFVDYSGKQIGIADPTMGEIREAEIFVGVLGASNLTYAEATWTQRLPDWTEPTCACSVSSATRGSDPAVQIVGRQQHAIFADPVNANLDLKDVTHVLTGLGAEIDAKTKSRVGVTLNGHAAVLHLTNHSLLKAEVMQIRKFLEPCGITIDAFPI